MSLLQKIDNARIVVCCGSGGVGKTSVSAALGVYGAMSGRNTLVLTIDPARRLADALGIGSFQHEVRKVPDENFVAAGRMPGGELFAMMLDTKRTFDRMIARHTASRRQRDRIFRNRYYQILSASLAGSHEYMAMEQLYEIHRQGRYELIILDTPPSRRALDFLEAPRRLSDLLGNNMLWKLVKPYARTGFMGMKMFNVLSMPVQKIIDSILGVKVFQDISDFFQLGDDVLFDGFRKRGEAVRKLLASPEALFVGITSPMQPPLEEVLFLYEKLMSGQMPFGGFIVNRVHPLSEAGPNDGGDSVTAERLAEKGIEPALAEKLAHNYRRFRQMGQSDRAAIARLTEAAGPDHPVRHLPYMEEEIHDIGGLLHICELLRANDRTDTAATPG